MKILFVGNSFIYNGEGESGRSQYYSPVQIFDRMADLAGRPVEITGSFVGGGDLKQQWDGLAGNPARAEIAKGTYDLVVFAGGDDYGIFNDYGNRFANLAQRNGAEVLFYGVWPHDYQVTPNSDSFGPAHHNAYSGLARRTDSAYSPATLAYAAAYEALRAARGQTDNGQQIEDYLTYDGVHAAKPLGLLIASVLYGTVFGEKAPTGISVPGVSASDKKLLQDIAWDTVRKSAIFVDDKPGPDTTPTQPTPATPSPVGPTPTIEDDSVTGTSRSEDIMSDARSQTLDGGGGRDRVFGGEGQDRIIFDGSDTLYFGGAGADTFVFDGGTSNLNMRVYGVETFDLKNGARDVLILQLDDIRQADGDLVIHADGNDAVRIDTDHVREQIGTRQINGENYDIYRFGGSETQTLAIDSDADVFVF